MSLLAGCQGGMGGGDVLVKAWGKPLIMRRVFESRLAERAPECQQDPDQGCAELKKNLLGLMIEEALLLAYAEKKGVEVANGDLKDIERVFLEEYRGAGEVIQHMGIDLDRWRTAVQGQLQMHLLLDEVLKDVEVNDQDVEAYYRDHREFFVQPREVRVRQIVLDHGEEAAEILKRLKKGADFSYLAKQYSLGPEAATGGDLGFLRPSQMPLELEEVAFSLNAGEFSEVIPSAYGFHIVLVEDRREPRELSLSEVEEEIRRRLFNEKAQRAYEVWLRKKWDEAKVEILDSTLASMD